MFKYSLEKIHGKVWADFVNLLINRINFEQTQSWYQFVELDELILNMYNIKGFYSKNEEKRWK
mgnify:CR=1 FL=1